MLVVLVVGLQQLVPPGEGGGVVPDEVHVVEVVEAGAGVERDQVERVPGDVVTTEREQGKKSSLSDICLKKNNPFFKSQYLQLKRSFQRDGWKVIIQFVFYEGDVSERTQLI